MHIELTLRAEDGSSRDVSVRAPLGTTLAELCRELGAPPAAEHWSKHRRLAPSAQLGGAGLRTGDILSSTPPTEQQLSTASGLLRLRVVCGPNAGRELHLTRGVTTIGRDIGCDLVLVDPQVSRCHALVRVSDLGVSVCDAGSTHGTLLEGQRVDRAGCAWQPGKLLQLGDSYLALHVTPEAPAATRSGADGSQLVNRAPRPAAGPTREITFPVRAPLVAPQRVQWLAALLPAGVGALLAWLLHSPQFLLFTLLSPLIILGSAFSERIQARRTRTRQTGSFTTTMRAAEADLAAALMTETASRRHCAPDPGQLSEIAQTPGARIWERRPADADLLRLRLGLGPAQSRTRVRRGAETSPGAVLSAVPVEIDLSRGPVGVVATVELRRAVGRWLLAQLVTLCSPADVELTLLLPECAADQWRWARWLPHVSDRIARTPSECAGILDQLRELAEQRAGERSYDTAWPGPWQVLLLDRSADLTDQAALQTILNLGPRVGITAIALDGLESRLPASCATILRGCGETGTRLAVPQPDGSDAVVVVDQVSSAWAESVARALAPLCDAGGADAVGLPDSCRLVDLLDLDTASAEEITRRWAAADGLAGTVIGRGPSGPVTMDLVRDGPHALIAGTTGAGKSELLQSLVAGLAASYPPDQLSFVLVDYKGGAAFAGCAALPHTVGVVTDLDPHLTRRALASLDSELRRRERLLAECGAKDLMAYRAAGHGEPLARLVLVVDEFATLAEELPDFVSGVVGIAQRGRSLGIHLILATQRPSGVVSPEIRANTTLRIALRVADAAESSDVVGTDAACRISRHRPGRAYLGIGTQQVALQTARVAGPRPASTAERIVVQVLDEWRRPPSATEPDEHGPTDLDHLTDLLRTAARRWGASSPRRPWLPPLPSQVAMTCATDAAADTICLGLADRPEHQAQPPVELDLAQGRSLLFAGTARSGRTSALVTLSMGAALRLSPQDLHVHTIDNAGGVLRTALLGLPHLGTVAGPGEPAIADRLLCRLEQFTAQRHRELGALAFSTTAQARAAGHRLPVVMLLLDGWETFVGASEEYDGGRSVVRLMELLRSAPAAGLTIAITGDRGVLATRPASAVRSRYLLRLTDRSDYALAGLAQRAVPEHMPPGRAVEAATMTEVQLAHIDPAERGRLSGRRSPSVPCLRRSRCATCPQPATAASPSVSVATVLPRSGSISSRAQPGCSWPVRRDPAGAPRWPRCAIRRSSRTSRS
jgi:S-DNA-T family DNA segregation ATPase FtsK/SpoIIIE